MRFLDSDKEEIGAYTTAQTTSTLSEIVCKNWVTLYLNRPTV
jgi:hypothetical protein